MTQRDQAAISTPMHFISLVCQAVYVGAEKIKKPTQAVWHMRLRRVSVLNNIIVGLVAFVLKSEPYKCTMMSTTVTAAGEPSTTQFMITITPLLPKNEK